MNSQVQRSISNSLHWLIEALVADDKGLKGAAAPLLGYMRKAEYPERRVANLVKYGQEYSVHEALSDKSFKELFESLRTMELREQETFAKKCKALWEFYRFSNGQYGMPMRRDFPFVRLADAAMGLLACFAFELEEEARKVAIKRMYEKAQAVVKLSEALSSISFIPTKMDKEWPKGMHEVVTAAFEFSTASKPSFPGRQPLGWLLEQLFASRGPGTDKEGALELVFGLASWMRREAARKDKEELAIVGQQLEAVHALLANANAAEGMAGALAPSGWAGRLVQLAQLVHGGDAKWKVARRESL